MPELPRAFSHRIVTLSAAVFALTACADQPGPLSPALGYDAATHALSPASDPAPSPAEARYEIRFMKDMIDHHMMAILMSEICLERAIHEELRALCENIIAAQRAEIIQMQTWLLAWYGIAYEATTKLGDEKMLERMADLSPAEFEVEYMETMIRHHQRAVREGERCLDRAYHGELAALCHNIIVVQLQEIEIMQSWLCDWYGMCR